MNDELSRIREFRAEVGPPSPSAEIAARADLSAAIAAERRGNGTAGAARRLRARRRRRMPTLRHAAVLALSVAGVLISVQLLGARHGSAVRGNPHGVAGLGVSPGATGVSRLSTSPLVPKHGEYLYTASMGPTEIDTGANNRECVQISFEHRQAWFGADNSGALVEHFGPQSYTSPADRSICIAINAPVTGAQVSATRFPANSGRCWGLTRWVIGLSTNPRRLLVQMRSLDGGPRTAAEDFVHIGDALRETPASPAVRAALYRAALLIPGVRTLGLVRDHIGRIGIGVALISHGYRSELIFDPRNWEMLSEQSLTPSGKVEGWTVYWGPRIVDSLSKSAARAKTSC